MDDSQTEGNIASEKWRIALYYCYTPIPSVEDQIHFQKERCEALGLCGRIRVSFEGINGVLSGILSSLEDYENELRNELCCIRQAIPQADGSTEEETLDLDVKYCHLRSDIPVEQQLFAFLSVKATKEVVSLYEPTPDEVQASMQRDSSTGFRGRRRRRNRKSRSQQVSAEENETKEDVKERLSNFEPAPHLTPQEWNERLLSLGNDAILLDARNVYESRVGHFSVEDVPTLLTNTRKYSSLPSVLESAMPDLSGKHVFMYCTGGVRCERASVCLQAIADSEKFKNLPKPRGVYQLSGGIQRYLARYGALSSSENADCLYKGKNFVFDQRRTDPLVGGESPGRCLLCHCAHDDYDNGHAPSENLEARCCRCRMLVLVCNDCRAQVRSCGEPMGRPDLLCGKEKCVEEGTSVHGVEIIRAQKH